MRQSACIILIFGLLYFMGPPQIGHAQDCLIDSLSVSNIECPNDSTYIVTIDFEYDSVTNDFFDLRLRNGIFDTYRYEDLPIRVTLPADPNAFQYIKVNDNDNLDCFDAIEFEFDCLAGNHCNIYDLSVSNIECPNDSTYIVTIDFEYDSVTNDFFDLRLRNGIFDTYRYEDLPIRVTLPADPNAFQYIKVNDNDNLDCFDAIEFEFDCLAGNHCNIYDLSVSNIECPNDSTYIVTINFEYDSVTNDFFDLRLRNGIFDTYRYEDLPIRVTLPADPNAFQYIKVNDNDNLDCFDAIEFEVDCLATSTEVYNTSSILLYPNPAEEELWVRFNSLEAYFKIIHQSGTTSKTGIVKSGGRINISNLRTGMYYFLLMDDAQYQTYRFIKN